MNNQTLRTLFLSSFTSIACAASGCADESQQPSFRQDYALVESGGTHTFNLTGVSDPSGISVRAEAPATAQFVAHDRDDLLSGFDRVRVASTADGSVLVDLFDGDQLADQLEVEFASVATLTWETYAATFGPAVASDYVLLAGQATTLELVGRTVDGRVFDGLAGRSAVVSDDVIDVYQWDETSFVLVDEPGTYEVSFVGDGVAPQSFPLVVVADADVVGLDVTPFERDGAVCFVGRGRTTTGQTVVDLSPSYVVSDTTAVLAGDGAVRCFESTPATGTTVTATWNGRTGSLTF